MKRVCALLALFALVASAYCKEPPACPFEKVPPIKIGDYTLRISEFAAREKDLQKRTDLQVKKGYRCSATVALGSGPQKKIADDWSMSWLDETGKDLNGDGVPDAVVDGYSGGMHCCDTYWFVSLGERPQVYLELENAGLLAIDQRSPGHTYIRTWDDAFDYFDGLCHLCSPIPDVTLDLRGSRLIDVSSRFPAKYDKKIVDAKWVWEHEDGEDLASLQNCTGFDSFRDQHPCHGNDEGRAAALTVVLAYLYSGREQQAWKALDEMWPPSDRARIKNLILETRAKGVLSQVAGVKGKSQARQTKAPSE